MYKSESLEERSEQPEKTLLYTAKIKLVDERKGGRFNSKDSLWEEKAGFVASVTHHPILDTHTIM